jgi:hypothetical protein
MGQRRPSTPRDRNGFSILRQGIDFAKLFLKLLDTPDAIGLSGSVAVCRHGRPALAARHDRNRD